MNFKTRLKPSFSLIDLTPLVDVIFLLLLFFVLTSELFSAKSIPVQKAALHEDSQPLSAHHVLTMDHEGILYWGKKKELLSLEELKAFLERSEGQSQEKAQITFTVDKRLEYGDFLEVFYVLQSKNAHVRLVYQAS